MHITVDVSVGEIPGIDGASVRPFAQKLIGTYAMIPAVVGAMIAGAISKTFLVVIVILVLAAIGVVTLVKKIL